MALIDNFHENLKRQYFEEKRNVSKIILTEHKDTQYSVEFLLSDKVNHFLIIKNLEELKSKEAKYLLKQPKDCDYILIDILKSVVYIVELKNKKLNKFIGNYDNYKEIFGFCQ